MKSKELLAACRTFAERMIFSGIPDANQLLSILGLEYRQNKTVEDIKAARIKGIKAGKGKTEFELDMIEIYLSDVLKLKRKQHDN